MSKEVFARLITTFIQSQVGVRELGTRPMICVPGVFFSVRSGVKETTNWLLSPEELNSNIPRSSREYCCTTSCWRRCSWVERAGHQHQPKFTVHPIYFNSFSPFYTLKKRRSSPWNRRTPNLVFWRSSCCWSTSSARRLICMCLDRLFAAK